MIKIGISKTTFVKALQTRNITQFLSLLREYNNHYAYCDKDILSSIKKKTNIKHLIACFPMSFNILGIFLGVCKIEPKE